MNNILNTVNYFTNNSIENFKYRISKKLDDLLISYDGWFAILLAILLTIAFTITAALVIWCLTRQNKRFTGNWYFKVVGFSVSAECK